MAITFEEYQQKLKDLARLDLSIPLGKAVANTVDAYYDRIFIEGKKTDGSKIEYKSDNPVYINAKDGTPSDVGNKGKTGRSTFKSGKEHTSAYFESYKKFKQKIGKPILELFGKLQSSISSGTKKLDNTTYVLAVNQTEGDKIEGLQYGNGKWTGFGTIFKLSKSEKEVFQETFTREMINQINGTTNS
jgi:hypothetical protein